MLIWSAAMPSEIEVSEDYEVVILSDMTQSVFECVPVGLFFPKSVVFFGGCMVVYENAWP